MDPSITNTTSSRWQRFCRFIGKQSATKASPFAVRVVLIAALVTGVIIDVPTRNAKSLRLAVSSSDCPPPNPKIDLAFIIDRSGSLANQIDPPSDRTRSPGRGQTYNVEIEGVLRALLDPTVIPRDRSIAVAVVTFDGGPVVRVPMREIRSEIDAQAVAASVSDLKCANLDSLIDPCPAGDTNYSLAITIAANHLNQNHRANARPVLLMATDGEPTDPDLGRAAADQAERLGVNSELDVILMGLDSQSEEFQDNKDSTDQIVFPKPADTLPGATLKIDAGPCNLPGAVFGADCERQAREFADLARSVLRASVANTSFEVNTEADPDPDTPVAGHSLSLRQAIELANCNGGAATITFAGNVKTISPLIPLPPLNAPDITICGCAGQNCGPSAGNAQNCAPSITIDGALTRSANEQQIDGILIRSNHDTVRGLTINNFTRAGVAISPVIQSDIVGHNRIEANTFGNNKVAGVLVLDPQPNPQGGVVHTAGNTILGNTILDSRGCATPIDLGGDGRTENDFCDTDEGPNTLLNFPRTMTVTQSANSVIVSGAMCDPSCEGQDCPSSLIGAVVEVFAVTRFATNCSGNTPGGVEELQADPDNRFITGVIPVGQGRIGTDGTFRLDVSASPTCGYTATVTDLDGNTSELRFPCAGFANAQIPAEVVFPLVEPNGGDVSATFTIENTGCDSLVLTSYSVNRVDTRNELSAVDDGSHFSIVSPTFGPNSTIAPGRQQSFIVKLEPGIPRVSASRIPAAAETLPDQIVANLILNHNGCGSKMITLRAAVTTGAHLINPKRPRKRAKVTLEPSGDEFVAAFSVFDSNRDVKSAKYEFFDGSGTAVLLDNCCADLAAIQARYVAGQSFSVIQHFSNAKNHKEVATIRVTVCDNAGACDNAVGALQMQTAAAKSGPAVSSSGGAGIQSRGRLQTGKLILSSTEIAQELRGARARGGRRDLQFKAGYPSAHARERRN